MDIVLAPRTFVPKDFKVESWDTLQPYYETLKSRKLDSLEALHQWFKDRSELESILQEDLAWRYIRMTCDTANQALSERFNYFVAEIQPQIAPYSNDLDKKALECPFLHELKTPGYPIAIRNIEKDARIFREANIPLIAELEQEAHEFGAISGAMTVTIDGKELTLQQAADFLLSTDRSLREKVWHLIAERRLQDKDKLDNLYTQLIAKRHQVALNAGFENYRDYMFTAMGRFDYTTQDCFRFHEAIADEVMPLMNLLAAERKEKLAVPTLKPWDGSVNYFGTTPLKPFENGNELLEKTIRCFQAIDPFLGECLQTMKKLGHLDLESRKGKAPGGYNYPLDESGIPFIFMNATTTLRDLVTMVHEGGHALHSFLTKDLELHYFKHPTSEVAELASMSMELISMEHWHHFFDDKRDLARAKREHLEGVLQTLPWVATIDQYQHWVYETPAHSPEQRKAQWNKILDRYSNKITSWEGQEKFRDYAWQKQLHLYEVPFYYIEYAMAQLGAIAVWKNYKENPAQGFAAYLEALKLGYTTSIGEIYKAAGIRFDFSKEYIRDLVAFVKKEIEAIEL